MNTLKKVVKCLLNECRCYNTRRKIKDLVKTSQMIKIEVGAGKCKGVNGWLTMDIHKECDLCWDLRRGMPFPDQSISMIYSSHFLEHLTYREGQGFLDECMRVMKPGAIFSICLPNARMFIEAYMNEDSLDPDEFLGYDKAYNHTTRIDFVNYIAYMDGHHKYMFDEENICHILKAKGFHQVHPRSFNPELDSGIRDIESIYAEAIR